MTSKTQSDAEQFAKLQASGTATGKPGVSQADAEIYNQLTANGTATPNKAGVNQTLAEQYHKLSGS